MKSFKSRLAIIVAMMVFVTSFTFIGVSAEDANQLEAPAAEAIATPAANEGGNQQAIKVVSPVTGLVSYSSYESVVLEWNKSVVTTTETDKDGIPLPPTEAQYTVNGLDVGKALDLGNGRVRYVVNNLVPGEARETGDVPFTVVAYDPANITNVSAPATVIDAPVRTIAYKIQIKTSGKLKSHGGPKRTLSVKKGQYIYAYGFGGGKYIFRDNGSLFYCNMTRAGKKSCIYEKKWNYSREEAQFFVNAKGLTSRTGVLVWINTYTQHLYRFEGAPGNWVCVADFDCSTGKAASPSPTGVSGKKAVWKKIRTRHGIPYWSPYSDINAIHAKRSGWKIGVPSSNGCVRNYKENAKDVYDNAPIGTRVLLY